MASGELDALGNTGGDGDNRAGMCYHRFESQFCETQLGPQPVDNESVRD